MPWFEYVCERCGERVQRPRPVAYRNVAPCHNKDGCWDGTLVRVAPVPRPGARREDPAQRLPASQVDGTGVEP